jgi:tetratricopeptide (TPR) repeat protein
MKPLLSYLGCAALGLIALAPSTFAQSDARFAKANQEYTSSHFKEAIDDYEALVRSGDWSANLFYDLGNTYFRAGDFGRAILNYERALALEPHHPEAQANLQIARDEARALELQESWLERQLRFATVNHYTIAATIAFWVGAFCIAGLIFARRRSPGLIALSVLSLASFALFVTFVFWIDAGNKGRALAIVTGNGIEARVATADNANSVLTLPPGSQIKIVSERGDWLYAVLPNSLRGWLPSKSVEAVRL